MAPSNEPTYSIVNARTGLSLAERAWSAHAYKSRMKGLLGFRVLEPGQGLMIPRCNAIHTWFMKMRLDVIFVDRANRVLRVFGNAPAFRVFWGGWNAHTAIELPPGTIHSTGTQPGDQLECPPNLS